MKIKVKVKPNSRKQSIQELEDHSLIVHLKSPPVEGKANQELISLLAKKYQVTQSQIKIKLGSNSTQKLLEIITD
jgi:uncharacterized protein